jgi:hypothetical protein
MQEVDGYRNRQCTETPKYFWMHKFHSPQI